MPRGSPCRTRPARRCAPTPRGGSSRRTPAAPSTSTPSFTSSPDRRGTGPWWLVPAMRPRLPAIVEVPTGRRHPRPAPRLRHQAPPAGCADGRAPRSRRPGVGARPCRGDRNPRRDRRRASGGQRGLDDPGLGPQGGPRRPGLGHAGRVAGGRTRSSAFSRRVGSWGRFTCGALRSRPWSRASGDTSAARSASTGSGSPSWATGSGARPSRPTVGRTRVRVTDAAASRRSTPLAVHSPVVRPTLASRAPVKGMPTARIARRSTPRVNMVEGCRWSGLP